MPTAAQKVIVVTARVHPGETPASMICEGFLNFITSDHPVAAVLRDYCVFMVVPMLNPDGVFLGNYRSNSLGFDLNRCWLKFCHSLPQCSQFPLDFLSIHARM